MSQTPARERLSSSKSILNWQVPDNDGIINRHYVYNSTCAAGRESCPVSYDSSSAFDWPEWQYMSAPSTALAEETATAPPVSTEPVDFVDVERPRPNDAMNGRPAPATPTGWGSAVFSPNSKLVATSSVAEGTDAKGEVVLWSVTDPKPVARFEQAGRMLVTEFSPDGKWLAIGPAVPQSGVRLVNTATGVVDRVLAGPAARTNAIAWSRDGTRLAFASTTDKSIRLWNVPDQKFLKSFEPDASSILAMTFTPAGQLLAAGVPSKDRDGLALFDVIAGETTKTLKGHKELIESAAFSADAVHLTSVGWDATVRIWDVASGEATGTLKGHKKGIRSSAISGNGQKLASANDREFKLWDADKKELITDLGGPNDGAKFVAMSPDGAWLVSISKDGTAHLWDVEKKSETAKFDRDQPTMATIVENSPTTTSAASTANSPNDAPEAEAIQSLAYSNDGRWIALAREDGRISMRNAEDGKVARELEGFSDVAACVSFSRDSQRIAAGSFDKTVKVWNVESGELLASFDGHTNWVFSVAFSPDGTVLATGSYDKTIKLWNLAESKEIATLSGHTAGVRSVAFTRDGLQLITGSADRTAIVWSTTDFQPVATLKGHSAAVCAVACSPDGTTVATASEDSTVKLWKTADWTERATLPGTEGVMFWCLAFSPGGRTLAAGAFRRNRQTVRPGRRKRTTKPAWSHGRHYGGGVRRRCA